MEESNVNVGEKENNAEVEVKANAEQAETKENSKESNNDTAKEESSVESKESNNENANETPKEPPSVELLNKIKKQVEFYFGDVNMQRDKFLIEQTKLDDGWVPMSVMLNFKMLASLSKDIDVILKALEDSDLIEISKDRKKIRRSPEKPLPIYDEKYRKDQEARTVYLKGFPLDTTIETLKAHFEPTDVVESIIMRKYKKDKEYFFKGSILLLFKTLDDAKSFMNQESIKYKDTELIRMWLADYIASKEKEKEERRQKKAENAKGSKNNKNNTHANLPKGCVIHISNIQKELTKDVIKEKITELDGKVAYVDYNSGNTEGWIRLQGENSAVELLKKLDANVININDSDISCKLLEGDEEDTYLNKIQESMANCRFNRRDKGRNARKGFKRRHSSDRKENSKKIHVDE